MSAFCNPEDLIHSYHFNNIKHEQLSSLKTHLINHYNLMTLRQYKEKGQFLSQNDIVFDLPNQMMTWFDNQVHKNTNISKVKVTKMNKKPGHWTDNTEQLDIFKQFIDDYYDRTDKESLKFKELMIAFVNETGIQVGCSWNVHYESVFNTFEITYEKKVDPRFAHQNTSGTCYVYLQPKKRIMFNQFILPNNK